MKYIYFSFIFFILALILLPGLGFADAAPKPSMKFNLKYETSKEIKLLDGFQLECDNPQCNQFDTLSSQGPQGFHCFEGQCFSVGNGYKDYHKLILIFDDKVRVSNVFRNKSFRSSYEVIVSNDKLQVIDKTTFFSSSATFPVFVKAFFITLIIEMIVAFFFLLIARKPLKILWYLLLANIITLPLVWYVFPLFFKYIFLIFAEIIVFVLEAYFIHYFCKEHISLRLSFLLSFIVNLASFTIGTLLLLLTFIY